MAGYQNVKTSLRIILVVLIQHTNVTDRRTPRHSIDRRYAYIALRGKTVWNRNAMGYIDLVTLISCNYVLTRNSAVNEIGERYREILFIS